MKPSSFQRQRGFTLLETVIAIGVLAVLLTGFMVVFAPAAEGIRKSINVQQADRLASALELEFTSLRDKEVTVHKTGFNKSFDWIKTSNDVGNAVVVYQYRGQLGDMRDDGTPSPLESLNEKLPGKDYVVVPVVRKVGSENFKKDLKAIEGAVYLVKCTQLVFQGGELKKGQPGKIIDPKGTKESDSGDLYPEAVIAFSADFYLMPATSESYFTGDAFRQKFANVRNPVFSRNLAVRR